MLGPEAIQPHGIEAIEVPATPRVAHAPLAHEEILAGAEHRHAGGAEQDDVHHARAQDVVRRRIQGVGPRPLGDAVEPCHVVMRLRVTQARRRTDRARGDVMQQVGSLRVAADVGRQELAERVVPAGPRAVVEVAGRMAAEAPRLGDEDLVRRAHAEVGLDLAQQRRAEQFGEVEPHPVHAEGLGPVTQRGVHEALEHRGLGAHVVAAAAPIGEFALRIDAIIIRRVDRAEPVGRTEMIQHHVHDDGEAGLMAGADEVAELLDRDDARGRRILVRDAEGADGHVAPMIFLLVLVLELRARQQLERVHAERAQVVPLRPHVAGELTVTARGGRAFGQAEQVAQMAFEDHEVLGRRRHEAVVERSQCFRADDEAGGLTRADDGAGPGIDQLRLAETLPGPVVAGRDREPIVGAGEVFRMRARPGALPFGLQREQMARAAGGLTPADFDRAGARREHAELGRTDADERAEVAGRLEHVERIGSEDVAEFQQFRGLVDHPRRSGGRIRVGRMETEDMADRAQARDDEVAMVVGGTSDVVGVVRRLDPAVAVAQELEFGLGGGAQDLVGRDAQLEAFGAGDADGTQRPPLHVDGLAPVVEGAGDAHRAGRGFGAERLPEEEMDAAAFQPMARAQGPGADVGRLEQRQAGGRIQGQRRQTRSRPVAREHDEAGDLRLPARAGQLSRHHRQEEGRKKFWRAKAGFPPGRGLPTMPAWK